MKRVLLLGLLLVSAGQVRAVAPAPEELCATLQKSPWDAKAMQVMQTIMRNEGESALLRSRAMALCALSLIKQGNTNQFIRAVQMLEAGYPEEKGLVTVSVSEQYVPCLVCAGKGKRETSCPSCKGSSCTRCNGTRSVQTVCSACMGAGQQFKLSPAVLENYNRLLAEIVAITRENQLYVKRSAEALAEKENDKKIALLEAVLADFPKRADVGPVKKSLDEAQKIRAAALAVKLAQEKRDQEDLDVERLRGLRQADSANCMSALREIEDYLLKHPKCFARSELEEITAELTAKLTLRKRLISSGYWLAGICGVLLLTAFLKGFLASRKVEHTRPLPGMERIDKSKFTDPLADEREKTQARRHNKEQ
jgi:hypothetical protein